MTVESDVVCPDLQAGFEIIPLPYVILSADNGYRILAATNVYVQNLGLPRDRVIGNEVFKVLPQAFYSDQESQIRQNRAAFEACIRNKRIESIAVQRFDVPSVKPGGGVETKYWTVKVHPIFDKKGDVTSILVQSEDVTESFVSEPDSTERLRQSQRLEAMGQLAGGVAHDFNNILAIIMMKCDSMMKKSSLDEAAYKSFEQIRKTSERAAALTRQLLAFSRQQVLQTRPLNVNNVVKDLENILSRLVTEDISLKTKLAANLQNVMADAGQIEQIILNLVVNARDAMPKGGRITIETENAHLDKPMMSAMLYAAPGDYVLLTVRDTGAGMDAATQARIFEPFYTTKGPGKGTGLGLSTVYGIINQSKGTIWVYSEPHHGTTFKIYLPITAEAQEVVAPVEERTHKPTTSANILVVEDQVELRELICETLTGSGYKVYEAENGLRALDMVADRLQFDLIVTDVIMPEMSGKELGEHVQRLNPETKLLYLSGYTEETLTNHGISGSHPHFLEKPFSLDTLLEKVRVVLS